MGEVTSQSSKAYIAGFLDGDGSIFISRRANSFILRVSFANVNREVIERIEGILKAFGSKARIEEKTKFSKPNRKKEFLIGYCGHTAKNICEFLLPVLILKRKQAESALAFPVGNRGISFTDEDKEIQRMLYYKMKILNQGCRIKTPEKNLREEDNAWLAGFFDAEGSISIAKSGTCFRLLVRVTNTNRTVLEYIKEKFAPKGKIVHENFAHRKTVYYFYICGNAAKYFLKLILPYLIVKKERELIATAFPISERGLYTTAAEKNGQRLSHIQMASLNKQGER